MKKNIITIGLIILIVLIGILVVVNQTDRNKPLSGKESIPMADPKAIIHTKFGDITLGFFPKDAPKHVDNFIELSKKGFYNQTVFHRVIPNFMIQGGDPNSKSEDKSQHGRERFERARKHVSLMPWPPKPPPP